MIATIVKMKFLFNIYEKNPIHIFRVNCIPSLEAHFSPMAIFQLTVFHTQYLKKLSENITVHKRKILFSLLTKSSYWHNIVSCFYC